MTHSMRTELHASVLHVSHLCCIIYSALRTTIRRPCRCLADRAGDNEPGRAHPTRLQRLAGREIVRVTVIEGDDCGAAGMGGGGRDELGHGGRSKTFRRKKVELVAEALQRYRPWPGGTGSPRRESVVHQHHGAVLTGAAMKMARERVHRGSHVESRRPVHWNRQFLSRVRSKGRCAERVVRSWASRTSFSKPSTKSAAAALSLRGPRTTCSAIARKPLP